MSKSVLNSLTLLTLSAPVLAQTPTAPVAGGGNDFLVQLPFFIGIFLLFYFAFIRPQKAQQKKQAEFLAALKVGDEIVTSSGIIGTVSGLTDRIVTLEVSDDSEIKLLRSQVQGALKDFMSDKTQKA